MNLDEITEFQKLFNDLNRETVRLSGRAPELGHLIFQTPTTSNLVPEQFFDIRKADDAYQIQATFFVNHLSPEEVVDFVQAFNEFMNQRTSKSEP